MILKVNQVKVLLQSPNWKCPNKVKIEYAACAEAVEQHWYYYGCGGRFATDVSHGFNSSLCFHFSLPFLSMARRRKLWCHRTPSPSLHSSGPRYGRTPSPCPCWQVATTAPETQSSPSWTSTISSAKTISISQGKKTEIPNKAFPVHFANMVPSTCHQVKKFTLIFLLSFIFKDMGGDY